MVSVSQRPSKTIEVVGEKGVGKATLVGSLMYKCGGVDMLILEKLEKAGIHKYDQVMGYFVNNRLEPSFESTQSTFTIMSKSMEAAPAPAITPADCTIYIINAESIKSNNTTGDPELSISLCAEQVKNLVVIVNKMDLIEWSEEIYTRAVKAALTTLKRLGLDSDRNVSTPFIPISALNGDNLLESSANSAWFSGKAPGPLTVINALDLATTAV